MKRSACLTPTRASAPGWRGEVPGGQRSTVAGRIDGDAAGKTCASPGVDPRGGPRVHHAGQLRPVEIVEPV